MSRLIAVANDFIRRAQQGGISDLSAVKLHDLCYLAHGWRIGSAGELLFETPVMAHGDGVFCKELREQGVWGTKRITAPIEVFTQDESGMLRQLEPRLVAGDPAVVTLDYAWAQYGRLTPFETTERTREAGGPWDSVWNTADRSSDEPREIPPEVLRRWFAAQFKLRALAGVAGIRKRARSEADEHDEATELHHVDPKADNLRSA